MAATADSTEKPSSMAAQPAEEIMANGTVLRIFEKVIASDCVIKNQQRGDPELTWQQKLQILTPILQSTPGVFLTRFGSILGNQELDYFYSIGDHDLQYHVEVLRREVKQSKHRRKNRRLKAISELTANTDYFSEEAMQARNPLLYEQTIGQYLSEEEKEEKLAAAASRHNDCTLSSLIFENMDRRCVLERLKRQTEKEEEQLEEEDDDEEEEEEEEAGCDEKAVCSSFTVSSDPKVANVEKKMLKQEFIKAMQQSFLRGEDRDFDYSTVDQNEAYDDLHAIAQDDEDSYFDSEQPSLFEGDHHSPPQFGSEDLNSGTGMGPNDMCEKSIVER